MNPPFPPLRFDILTLFPHLFSSTFSDTILARALEERRFSIHYHQIRDFTEDRHRTVDDTPYGGGAGMVMKPEPLMAAIEHARELGRREGRKKTRVIYLSPQGRVLHQSHLRLYHEPDQIILLCGRYEGIDERVLEMGVDEEVSIGDYVLTGGEFAALVFVDAVVRLLPGVVGCEASLEQESHGSAGLEYPQYTRPPEFRGQAVPEVLLSGNHARIEAWRQEKSRERTGRKRPDLLKKN